MSIVLPSSLCKALAEAHYCVVAGWGYPDFAPRPPHVSGLHPIDLGQAREETARWFAHTGRRLWPLYQTIAELTAPCVLALTPDDQLGLVLRSHGSSWIVLESQQAAYHPGKRVVVPLGGLLTDPASITLPGLDLLHVPHRAESMWHHAQSQATQAPLLLLGCDPTDRLLRRLMSRLRPVPPHSTGGWIMTASSDPPDRGAWHDLGFEVVEGSPAALVRALAMEAGHAVVPHVRRQVSPRHDSPYKHLDFFERADSDVFFGRRSETHRLINMVCAHRVVVVTGPSGAGKTSLLNAGLLAWADHGGHIKGVYCRCGDDPVASIVRGVSACVSEDLRWDRTCEGLAVFLDRARSVLKHPPLIVLDQAEELFIRIAGELRQELTAGLRDCLTAMPLLARFVISLRDDYMTQLASLREQIPGLMPNVFVLREFERDAAADAIREPAEAYGLTCERGLPDQILNDLGTGLVAPPQLQIICSRLFEDREGPRIDRAVYLRLGGAEAILRDYLGTEIKRLGTGEADARRILKAMVTSEGTKESLIASEVARRADLKTADTHDKLLHLRDRSRLLRAVVQHQETRFELAHEYLTKEIWTWMTPEDLARRRLEELIARELRSWRRFGHLRLGLDRLQALEGCPKSLPIEEDGLVLLLLSAVRYRRSTAKWVARAQQLDAVAQDAIAGRIFEYFQDRDARARREAAETIAVLDEAPIVRALTSPSAVSRCAAVEMLGGLRSASAGDALVARLGDSEERIRKLACGALGEIGTPQALDSLFNAAEAADRNGDTVLAAEAYIALVWAGDRRTVPWLGRSLASNDTSSLGSAGIALKRCPPILMAKVLVSFALSDAGWSSVNSVIVGNPNRYIPALCDIFDKLSHPASQRVIETLRNCHRHVDMACLATMRRRKGPIGKWANEAWHEQKQKESKRKAAEKSVNGRFTGRHLLRHLQQKLGNDDFQVCFGASTWLARQRHLPEKVVLALLRSKDHQVRAHTIDALGWGPLQVKDLATVLQSALTDADATVRFCACHTAGLRDCKELVDVISDLLDDPHRPKWVFGDERTVGDAAHAALDRLHPPSRVWRKPFQTSFNSWARGDDTEA